MILILVYSLFISEQINVWFFLDPLQCYSKCVKALLGVASYADHCVLATKAEDPGAEGGFCLVLCNAISTPIDSK